MTKAERQVKMYALHPNTAWPILGGELHSDIKHGHQFFESVLPIETGIG